MDKTAIKNYAVAARKKLIQAIKLKAQRLYIFEDSGEYARQNINRNNAAERIRADGIFLTPEQIKARETLYSELLHDGREYTPETYNRVMENVAYTWFNRLIALRFMEVNDYLPSNIRILSSLEHGRIEPDALRNVENLDYVDQRKIATLQADKDLNASEKLYKYILISQCNALSAVLPGMFQKIDDYTELLLPDVLYAKGGIVHDLVNAINEDDFNIQNQGQIEIIGWLYQFYISEKKDEVFAALKKNVKINKDTIPAATQLFTPEWIVKYMVENSLGRLWLESNPNDELRKGWKYYVDEAEQEPEVAEQLRVLRSENPIKRPEDIKLIDPCMGSGHILVYAFDVLFQIYESVGYSEREIPNLILQHNIYGLDIDDRAGQLAYFALMMKARSYSRRFLRQDSVPQPMVYSAKGDSELELYGSALKLDSAGEKPELTGTLDDFDYQRRLNSWNYRNLLAQKYDIAVTNPPYMSPAPSQVDWVKKNYPNSKSDFCVVFIERNFDFLKPNGYLSMITMHSWMFLTSYENFRENLIGTKNIASMAHLGARAFEEIGGEVVQTTAFIMGYSNASDYLATYVRLVDYVGQQVKEKQFLEGGNRHTARMADFAKIPGGAIAYWIRPAYFYSFEHGKLIGSIATPKQGSTLGDNAAFIRFWFEVVENPKKWFKCMKGGEYRKWYGNILYLLDWENNGQRVKSTGRATIRSESLLFKKGITWSNISSSNPSFRLMEDGFFFESTGTVCFTSEADLFYLLAFLNTPIVNILANIVNPTLHLQSGDVAKLPILHSKDKLNDVNRLVERNISISRADWDSFETSWDFTRHPLVSDDFRQGETTIKATFANWEYASEECFRDLKSNEEELNRIFIEIYGLQDELTPEVEDKDVTIRRADLARDIRSFISYAVGCMFGRYSLDEPGLIFAGGKFDASRYTAFKPVDDNIVPIGTADYFESDIVLLFVEFVRVVYGDGTLGENLSFIADALYPNANGTAQDKIRRYFLNDFYKDHVKIYQKRPIYWLFDSGKKDGFKALFYLHRYDKYTVARVRTDYLHPQQRKYDGEIKRLEMLSSTIDNARDKAAYRKEIGALQTKMDECRAYDQIVSHIAHQQITLDLDDGVKVNYEKFQSVEVPKDDGKTEKMDLLRRI